jgi:uncharacterized protein YceH (UPF0502 family)
MCTLTRFRHFGLAVAMLGLLLISGGNVRSDDAKKAAVSDREADAAEKARLNNEIAAQKQRSEAKAAREKAEKALEIYKQLTSSGAQKPAVSRIEIEMAQQHVASARYVEFDLLAKQVEELQKELAELRKEVRRALPK